MQETAHVLSLLTFKIHNWWSCSHQDSNEDTSKLLFTSESTLLFHIFIHSGENINLSKISWGIGQTYYIRYPLWYSGLNKSYIKYRSALHTNHQGRYPSQLSLPQGIHPPSQPMQPARLLCTVTTKMKQAQELNPLTNITKRYNNLVATRSKKPFF